MEPLTQVVLQRLLGAAQAGGVLKLQNRDVKEVPAEVWELAEKSFMEGSTAEAEGCHTLMLGGNDLHVLSGEISRLADGLVRLDVAYNELTELPASLGDCSRLQVVNLAHNKLERLPESIGGLTVLRELDLGDNPPLVALPAAALGRLAALRELSVKRCGLRTLPDELPTGLLQLDVSENQLTALPGRLARCTALVRLDCSRNQLATLPAQLGGPALEVFLARENALRELPPFDGCPSLTELDLTRNHLTEVPRGLEKCPKLASLSLGSNLLSEWRTLHEALLPLQPAIRRIDLSTNNLSNLPPQLGLLEGVDLLLVDGNPMRAIRPAVIQRGTKALLDYLRLKLPPSDVSAATSAPLETQGCQLVLRSHDPPVTEWPAVPAGATSVVVQANQLAALPANVFAACAATLRELTVEHNRVQALPAALCQSLVALEVLNLRANRLREVPEEVGALRQLRELVLAENILSSLPTALATLPALEVVDVAGNTFEEVPATLQGCRALRRLVLANNDIIRVDPRLANWGAPLESLRLEGNPIRTIKRELLTGPSPDMLEWMRTRIVAE